VDLLATDGITTLAVLGFTVPAVLVVAGFAVVVIRDRRSTRGEDSAHEES
jgi:hypothetical protein